MAERRDLLNNCAGTCSTVEQISAQQLRDKEEQEDQLEDQARNCVSTPTQLPNTTCG